jgi:integrase
MALGKQAKTLSKGQVDAMLAYLSTTRHPERNKLIFLLSAKAGLRAKEIAKLTWRMTNGEHQHRHRPPGLREQGQIRPVHPPERRGSPGPDRVPRHGPLISRPPRHLHRAISGDLCPGHREHVPPAVPAPRVRRLLQP